VSDKIEPENGDKLAFSRSQQCQEIAVFAKLRFASAFAGLICIAAASTTNNASAAAAEVAKKCSALTAKAFPPRVIGNPAAGSAKGTPQEQQDYFKKCAANGGNIDEDDARNQEK
jgi:hypothetical protein